MALAPVTNPWTLSRWGYFSSDISVISGAGRNVGTWVKAQLKDQALLDFMNVTPEDLVVRRGLVDMNSLHRRWDVTLTLLQNGKLCKIDGRGHTVVENMGKFSWLMTLIISGLDASLQLGDVRKVMTTFLRALFREQVDGLDYLLRELPQHIQGWISAACVRNILTRAREEWATLAARGKHLPGQIPSTDVEEIQQLLVWLAGAKNQEHEKIFRTNSTDVFSLALVFQVIGLDITVTNKPDSEHDESKLVVMFTEAMISSRGRQFFAREPHEHRRGMRIPLDSMKECVSLWPGTSEKNNERRKLFIDGAKAANNLSFRCMRTPEATLKNPEIIYAIINSSSKRMDHVDDEIYRLAEDIFPLTTFETVRGLRDIIADRLVPANDSTLLDQLYFDHNVLAEVQLFTMGFYYALLRTLLDTSQLGIQEAYGSWKWYDHELLHQIRDILRDTKHTRKLKKFTLKPIASLKRDSVLKLLALFFAGAEKYQIASVSDNIIGIHAKLSLLSASALGNADTPDKVSKFFLLGVDATAIPSNARGLVIGGANHSEPLNTCIVPDQKECLKSIEDVKPGGLKVDFTTHIEPDWDHDIQSCTVVFRYMGRMIRRLSPLAIDLALLPETEQLPYIAPATVSLEPTPNNPPHPPILLGEISSFSSGYLGHSLDTDPDEPTLPTIVLATKGCSKARTCLRAIYHLENYKPLHILNPFPGTNWMREVEGEQNGAVSSGEVMVLYQPDGDSWWEESTRRVVIA